MSIPPFAMMAPPTSNRRPLYHPADSKLRVISAPSGLWVAQRWVGRDDWHRNTKSGWEDIGSPMSLADAIEQMTIAT